MEFLLFACSGFIVGTLIGLTGVGGGALMTPLLVITFGIPPQIAVGTDLLFASITKAFGVNRYQSFGNIDWGIVRRLAYGSIPAAAATILTLHSIENISYQKETIMKVLGLTLLITAIAIFFKPELNTFGKKLRSTTPLKFKALQPGMTILAGSIIGFLVSLTSIGAGALGAVMLVYLYPFRLSPQKLIGTDLAHAIPLALFAGMGHLLIGNIDFKLLGNLLIGSIPGVLIGAKFSSDAPDKFMRNILAIVLAAIGIKAFI